jgi:serine/threonine protein phosphatase PrpC
MDAKVNWSNYLEHATLSDLGMRRGSNQDASASVLAPDEPSWHRRGHVFMVADGMGAHAAGELASKLAVEGVPFSYHKLPDAPAPDAIRKSVREVNQQINRRGEANAEFRGMGTTASVLVVLPQGALVAHVGDSRVYRLRKSTLEQLTFDHSLVWEMSAAGQIAKEDLPQFVPKNIITRSLGPHADVQVDLEGPYPTEPGDTFLLCSDGLTGQLKDEEIGAILGSLPPDEAARVLVDLANLRGGPDNITVIIVRVVGNPPGAGAAEPLAVTQDLSELRAQKLMRVVMLAFAAVCLVAAIVLFSLELRIPALVSVAAAVVLFALGMLQTGSSAEPQLRYLRPGATLGKGPHVRVECQPGETLVSELRKLVDQLRDAATEGNWSLDWSKFNSHSRQAETAAQERNYSQAVRDYARALRAMMTELRNQRLKGRRSEPEDGESLIGR